MSKWVIEKQNWNLTEGILDIQVILQQGIKC